MGEGQWAPGPWAFSSTGQLKVDRTEQDTFMDSMALRGLQGWGYESSTCNKEKPKGFPIFSQRRNSLLWVHIVFIAVEEIWHQETGLAALLSSHALRSVWLLSWALWQDEKCSLWLGCHIYSAVRFLKEINESSIRVNQSFLGFAISDQLSHAGSTTTSSFPA